MVIDIILDNGKKLLLDADTQIEWVRENMFFEKDVNLRGKYSYPFSINREANSETFDFPDIIEAETSNIKFGCRLLIYGTEFYKGQINVLDWDNNIINIAITRDTAAFDTDQYIDELGLKTYSGIADSSNINANRGKVYPEVDYAFPQFYNINKDNFESFSSVGIEAETIMANWNNGNSETTSGGEVYVPMFYVLSVIQKVFARYNLAIKTPLINDSDFKKKVVFNPILPVLNPTIEGAIVFDSKRYTLQLKVFCKDEQLINFPVGTTLQWKVIEYGFSSTYFDETFLSYTLTSTDVAGGTAAILEKIKDEMIANVPNLQLEDEDYPNDGTDYFIVSVNTGRYLGAYDYYSPLTSINAITSRPDPDELDTMRVYTTSLVNETDIHMNKHLPHITVSVFLSSLKNMFNLSIDLDEVNDVFYINFRKSLINTLNLRDFTSQLIEGNEGLLETAENIAIVLDHDDGNDDLAKNLRKTADNYPQAALEPITEIQTGAGTCLVEYLRNSNSGFRNQAKIDQKFGYYNAPEDFGLRFLHCYGYVADTAGFKSDFADNNGLTANEVYTNYYKDWYEFILQLRKSPTYYFDFGIIELKEQLPTIWRVKYTDFVWKRMTTIIHNTEGILPTRVEGYRKG